MRPLLALLALAALAAGCIAPDDAPASESTSARAEPPADRIDDMTADAQKADSVVVCAPGSLTLPRFCAERVTSTDTTSSGGNATLLSLEDVGL